MSQSLASSYPTGDYLEGNFITYYTTNYQLFDRYVVKLFGERAIEVDDTETLSDTVINWTYDVDGIVFSHLNEWAKMYSASIKDYEPIWNVDGTVETTYGATKRTEDIKQKIDTDVYGAREENTDYGARHTEDFNPTKTDTTTEYETAYPDGLSKETGKTQTQFGNITVEHDTDRALDTFTTEQYQDTHTQGAHKDIFEEDQHKDTERRTGNIGVTKSSDLVESEFRLREAWNFYKLIFGYIVREMGCIYYDWH